MKTIKIGLLLFLTISLQISWGQTVFNETEINSLLEQRFPKDSSGATAIIYKDGKEIFKKAYGLANIELNVAMQPDMIFRIGSITKQFTAVAILQLYEQKKLDLQDDILKYIPDYPTHGNKITIEHLLTHTSGIKSYTSMPDFGKIMPVSRTPTELIAFFKDQPMDFKPGEKYKYNNSGYVLLGYIIEKVSNMSYPDYVKEKIFQPLGMHNSYYGNDLTIIKNRAAGYDNSPTGITNANPLSMTLPYAAGSLLSTVGDLAKWNESLFSYKLITKASLDKAITPYTLLSGEKIKYGYGLSLTDLQGTPIIAHGGGINGFLSFGLYIPEKRIYVAILSNSTAKNPEAVALKIGALMLGKPIANKFVPPPAEKEVREDILAKYTGEYQLAPNFSLVITKEGKRLFAQATGQSKFELFAETERLFFLKVVPAKVEFIEDKQGNFSTLILHQNGQKPEGKKVIR